MRYLKINALLVFVLALVVSCSPDKGDTDYLNNRTPYIYFAKTSADFYIEEGAANTYDVKVALSAPQSQDLMYDISIDPNSDAVEGVDFTISSPSFKVQAGSIVGSFTVLGDFNAASIDGKSVTFLLSSVDDADLGQITEFTLNLFKLCPYEGLNTTSYAANVYAFSDEAPSYNTTLSPVPGTDNQWTISTAWGTEFVAWATGNPAYSGLYVYSATIVLNEDFTVDVIGNDALATGGTGTFSPCTQQFSFTLTQGLFTNAFTVDTVLSPM